MEMQQNLIERRQYMQQLRDLKGQNIIKVVSGVRRCGKSTLLMMFADELLQGGVTKEQIQFYNFEDLDTLAIGDIYQIHTYIKEQLMADKQNYIFLDEIQNVKEFQRLLTAYISSRTLTFILQVPMRICFPENWPHCSQVVMWKSIYYHCNLLNIIILTFKIRQTYLKMKFWRILYISEAFLSIINS